MENSNQNERVAEPVIDLGTEKAKFISNADS
jgi:hypothetical protein